MVWLGGIAGGLAVLLLGLWLYGRGIERTHKASVSRDYDSSPEEVWTLITDVEEFTEWRSGLKDLEVKERDGDRPIAWVEHTSFGPMPFRTLEFDPPRKLVGKIDSDDLGFGGTWTWEVTPRGGGCTLAITERGHIDNPLFRILSKHVFGYEGTMKRVQDDIAAALSE